MASTKGQLRKHIQVKHEKLRYNCNECDYMANIKDQLKIHIQVKHEKLIYNCNECEYMANTKGQLKYRFWFDLSATIKLTYIKRLSVFWFVSDSCTLFCNVAAIVPIILNVHYLFSGSTKQSGPTSSWDPKFGHLTRPLIYVCLYMNKYENYH